MSCDQIGKEMDIEVLVFGSSFASLAAVLVYAQLPFSLVVAKSFRG